MSVINSNDTIGNRTRDLPACGAVPQATEPTPVPGTRKSKSGYNCRLLALDGTALQLEDSSIHYSV